MNIASVGCHYCVSESMICYIKKNQDKIWRSIKTCAPLSAEMKTISGGSIKTSAALSTKIVLCRCDCFLEMMEGPRVFGWKIRHWNGCQSVLLCGGRGLYQSRLIGKLYQKYKALAFQILIIVDKFPGCLQDLNLTHPSIEAEYLFNTTSLPSSLPPSLLEPLDHGIIKSLKLPYT